MRQGLKLALRDLRGGLSGLLLLWACLAIAVAGIAAVGSLASAIDSALAANSRQLLGADLMLSVAQRQANAEELRAMAEHGRVAPNVTTRATVVVGDGRSALAELAGVGMQWPLVGTIELAPGGRRPGPGEVAVGAELAERLGLRRGDRVRIGYGYFRVSGIIRSMPSTAGFALAPPALMNEAGLAATGLIRPGSLFTSAYRIATAPGADPEAIGAAFQRRFPSGGWRSTDRDDAGGGTRRFVDRVEQLLLLIALVGLAIGGIGIASAARAFAESRRGVIATLKLLGASGSTVRAMLAAEIAIAALLALAIALAIGALTPSLAAGAVEGWLPVAPDRSPQWRALGLAAGFGVLVTVAASWGAIVGAARTRPAELFRQDLATPPRPSVTSLAIPLLAAAGALALAVASARNALFTALAIAALAAVALLFAGLGLLIRRLARRGAAGFGPLVRLGISALDRPGAATVRLSVAIGLGLSLLAMLAAVSSSLLRNIETSIPDRAPALFLVDIPATAGRQVEILARRLAPGSELRLVPTLRGSVTAINGMPVNRLPAIPEGAWVLRGDRGLTFAAELPPANELVAGDWWPADYRGPPLISLDAGAAEALDLTVGDSLTITVLGRPIEARIASLRRIDWRSMGFNFAIVFAPGALESAPYTLMATLAPPAGTGTLAFEQALTGALPMVSAIRVADIVEQVRAILVALDGAVRLATGLAIAIGIVVLAGSVIATRRARQRETVLLKLVGATRGEVLRVQLIEFALLCFAVVLVAVAVGAAAAWAVLRFLLELDFTPAWQALVLPPAIAILLCLAAALLAALPALLVRPAQALRAAG